MSTVELNDPEIASLLNPPFNTVSATAMSIFAPPLVQVSEEFLPVALGAGETAPTAASLLLSNMNATGQNYKFYANNGSGGGLSDGHLQLFSYNTTPNWCSQVLDIAPQTSDVPQTNITIPGDLYVSGLINGSTVAEVLAPITLPSSSGLFGATFQAPVAGNYLLSWEAILVNPTWDPTADFIKFYLAANGTAVAWFSIASVPTSVANSFSFNGTLLVPLDATSTYQFGLTIVGAPVYASNSGLSVSTIKLLN